MPKAVYITDPGPTETAAYVDQPTFNVLSLCSGVGGLDLGLRLAVGNARTVCYVEREAYCCEVLAERMADGCLDAAPVWTDLRTFDGKPWRSVVDCVVGGYPCQPFSKTGKRLADADPRHLWPDITRIIREIEPEWCFFENVADHIRLGFERVERDLRAMGYTVAAGLFSAAEAGYRQHRERLYIVANTNRGTTGSESRYTSDERWFDSNDRHRTVVPRRASSKRRTDPPSSYLARVPPGPDEVDAWHDLLAQRPDIAPAVKPAIRGVADGMAPRVDRLRAAGNGVVPAVASLAWRTLAPVVEEVTHAEGSLLLSDL